MVLCTGCFTDFPRGSYARHIALTLNPACRAASLTGRPTADAVHDNATPPPKHDATEDFDDAETDDHNLGADMDIDSNDLEGRAPQPIQDFFGTDYTSAELGLEPEDGDGEHGAQPPSDESEWDDSADELSPDEAEPEEAGWEAPVEEHDIDGDLEGDLEQEVEDGIAENEEEHTPENINHTLRTRVEAALCQQIHVEHFPSEVAGQPVVLQNNLPSGYGDYQTRLPHIGGPENPYSPFANELDWSVGKWAKLRGPGSTAVSDLLEIPGVRSSVSNYALTHANSPDIR